MVIKKTSLPLDSLAAHYLPADYTDTFVCEVDTTVQIAPDDVLVCFWTDFPAWVKMLFGLRNFLVRFVGLKGAEDNNLEAFEECIRTGVSYGLASIPTKNEQETVLLLTDKHLNAYLSVRIEKNGEHNKVFAITLVHYHNTLGRVYFFFVRPFHGVIMRCMLKRSVWAGFSRKPETPETDRPGGISESI